MTIRLRNPSATRLVKQRQHGADSAVADATPTGLARLALRLWIHPPMLPPQPEFVDTVPLLWKSS